MEQGGLGAHHSLGVVLPRCIAVDIAATAITGVMAGAARPSALHVVGFHTNTARARQHCAHHWRDA